MQKNSNEDPINGNNIKREQALTKNNIKEITRNGNYSRCANNQVGISVLKMNFPSILWIRYLTPRMNRKNKSLLVLLLNFFKDKIMQKKKKGFDNLLQEWFESDKKHTCRIVNLSCIVVKLHFCPHF